jgi:hypothetical protein
MLWLNAAAQSNLKHSNLSTRFLWKWNDFQKGMVMNNEKRKQQHSITMSNVQHHNHYFTNFTNIFRITQFFSAANASETWDWLIFCYTGYPAFSKVPQFTADWLNLTSKCKSVSRPFCGNSAHIQILCQNAMTWFKLDFSLFSQVIDTETYAVMNKFLDLCHTLSSFLVDNHLECSGSLTDITQVFNMENNQMLQCSSIT